MPGSSETQARPERPADIAAPWHTAILIALYIAVAAVGTLLTRRGIPVQLPATSTSRSLVYLQMTVVTWGLLLYACLIGRRENALPALLGKRWNSVGRALFDVVLAAMGFMLIRSCEWVWMRLFETAGSTAVLSLLPRSGLECAAWVVVSMSVGFCEEVVFRGYLQTQLAAFTGSMSVAILLQAMLFGLSHGDQGIGAVLRLAIYGLGFGALAHARKSLVPGILCHIATNLASGLLRI